MEREEIKHALEQFRRVIAGEAWSRSDPPGLAKIFLEQVMGYSSEEEIWHKSEALTGKLDRLEFNERVKFFLQPLCFGQAADQDIIERAARYSLSEQAGLFGLLNGQYFKLYELDISQGSPQIENVLELDLLNGQPEELANFLWPISKRDCGRKIIINLNTVNLR